SVSLPAADIRSSIARSSSLTIGLLLSFCRRLLSQTHVGSSKESLQLFSLVGFESAHVLKGQLSESLAQTMKSNPRRPVGNAELVGDLAERHVTTETNHHYSLGLRQLANRSFSHPRDRSAHGRRNFRWGARAKSIIRVALRHDSFWRC